MVSEMTEIPQRRLFTFQVKLRRSTMQLLYDLVATQLATDDLSSIIPL